MDIEPQVQQAASEAKHRDSASDGSNEASASDVPESSAPTDSPQDVEASLSPQEVVGPDVSQISDQNETDLEATPNVVNVEPEAEAEAEIETEAETEVPLVEASLASSDDVSLTQTKEDEEQSSKPNSSSGQRNKPTPEVAEKAPALLSPPRLATNTKPLPPRSPSASAGVPVLPIKPMNMSKTISVQRNNEKPQVSAENLSLKTESNAVQQRHSPSKTQQSAAVNGEADYPVSPNSPISPQVQRQKIDPTMPTNPSDPYDVLSKRLEYLLLSPEVDIIPESEFRSIVFHIGVPEGLKQRSLVWKLLLKYLPFDRRKWSEHFKRSRREYATFMNMLTVNPYADMENEWKKRKEQQKEEQRRKAKEEDELGKTFELSPSSTSDSEHRAATRIERLKGGDDPLACGVGSNKWTEYYRDQDIQTEIEKDVKRTYSTLHFFQLPVHPDDRPYHNALLAAQAETERREKAEKAQSAMRRSSNQSLAEADAKRSPQKPLRNMDASSIAPIITLSADPPTVPMSPVVAAPSVSIDDDLDLNAVPSIFGDMTTPGQRPAQRHLGGDLSMGGDLLSSKTLKAAQMKSIESGSSQNLKGTAVQPLDLSTAKQPECHHDVLRRVLFLFAKLNPGIRYVQGMNEILAPIYYVFANDPDIYSLHKGKSCQQALDEQAKQKAAKAEGRTDEEQKSVVVGSAESNEGVEPIEQDVFDFADPEADAFFCFSNIMSELRDRFIKSLDSSETGVLSIVRKLNEHLKQTDFELWKRLESVEVDPRFYSFRWLTLLLSQEFQLPEVIRLWDTFFAGDDGFEFQLTFCCAMLVNVRESLLEMDFSGALKLLQQYPDTDIQILLQIAHDLKANGSHSQYVVSRKPSKQDAGMSATSRIANFFKSLTKK